MIYNIFIKGSKMIKATRLRVFRVLFVLTFILDLTLIGAIIGIPLFLLLWAGSYIAFGVINPFYVFKKWVSIKFLYTFDIKSYIEQLLTDDAIDLNMLDTYHNAIRDYIFKDFKETVSNIEKEVNPELLFTINLIHSIMLNIYCDSFAKATGFIYSIKCDDKANIDEELLASILPKIWILDFIGKNKNNLSIELFNSRDLDYYLKAKKLVSKMMQFENSGTRMYQKQHAKSQFKDDAYSFEYSFLPKVRSLFDVDDGEWGILEEELICKYCDLLETNQHNLSANKIQILTVVYGAFKANLKQIEEDFFQNIAKKAIEQLKYINESEIKNSAQRAGIAISIYKKILNSEIIDHYN